MKNSGWLRMGFFQIVFLPASFGSFPGQDNRQARMLSFPQNPAFRQGPEWILDPAP